MRFSFVVVLTGFCLALAVSASACNGQTNMERADEVPSSSVPTNGISPTMDPLDDALASAESASLQPQATPASFTFPTQPPGSASMQAELRGQLFDAGGCFWVAADEGGMNYGIVWPYGYSWRSDEAVLEVLDAHEAVVARAGDPIYLAGGEAGAGDLGCLGAGLVWIAAEPIHIAN